MQPAKDKKSTVVQPKVQNLNNVSDNDEQNSDDENCAKKNSKVNINDLDINDLEECLRLLIKSKTNAPEQTPPNQNKKIINSVNDTEKINRLKSSFFGQENDNNKSSDEISLLNSNQSNNSKQPPSSLSGLNDEFKKALFELENKLNDFERHLGKQTNADGLIKRANLNQSKQPSYSSSYTLTLIQIVSNLLDYLRDAVIELNYEKLKQVESNKQLGIHRKLIDGLTTEVLTVKEQNEKIINEFMSQNAKIVSEMDQIKVFFNSFKNFEFFC